MGEPGADTEPLYTTGAIAKMLRVCRKTVTRYIDKGYLACEPRLPGGNRRCRESEVNRFIAAIGGAPAQ